MIFKSPFPPKLFCDPMIIIGVCWYIGLVYRIFSGVNSPMFCILLACVITLQRAGVRVLAEVELIFFILASMGLCLGFVLEIALKQGCFSYC